LENRVGAPVEWGIERMIECLAADSPCTI